MNSPSRNFKKNVFFFVCLKMHSSCLTNGLQIKCVFLLESYATAVMKVRLSIYP